MKTTAQIFIAIFLSLASVFGFLSLMSLLFDDTFLGYIPDVLIVCFAPLSIAINFMALFELDKAKKQKDIRTIAILTLVFFNFVSGIIMLGMIDEDLQKKESDPASIENADEFVFEEIPKEKEDTVFDIKRPATPQPAEITVTKADIQKIKDEMEELGFTSLEEYKAYVKLSREQKEKEMQDYAEILKMKNDL